MPRRGQLPDQQVFRGVSRPSGDGESGALLGGCLVVDELETYCIAKWREVFHTDYHVNVQPHSGTSANLAAYMALLQPGDRVLSMSLANGGHLSHGLPVMPLAGCMT